MMQRPTFAPRPVIEAATPALGPVAPMPLMAAPAVKRPGMLDGIRNFMGSDDGRAALLRAGAATLSSGDIGAGILAGANFSDERNRAKEAVARDERDYRLRERGVTNQERQTDASVWQGQARIGIDQQHVNQTGDYQRGQLAQQRYSTDVDSRDRREGYAVTREGYGVQERNNVRDNDTRIRTETIQSGDRRYAVDHPTASQQPNVPSPSRARGVLDSILPSVSRGIEGFDDAKNVAGALQGNPELYGELSDAAMAGYQRGGTSGAIQAAQGVLGRYQYQPFKDGWFGDTPAAFTPRQAAPARGGGQGGALRPGTEVDGFIYQGGDPNAQSSWRPVA